MGTLKTSTLWVSQNFLSRWLFVTRDAFDIAEPSNSQNYCPMWNK